MADLHHGSGGMREIEIDDADGVPVSQVPSSRADAERQAQYEASSKRAAQLKAERDNAARKRRRKLIVIASVVVLSLGAAVPLTRAVLREASAADALRAALDAVSKTAGETGFKTEKEWLEVPAAGISFEIPADTCSVIVAASAADKQPLPIKVERGEKLSALDGPGVSFCSCEPTKVVVKVGPQDSRTAVRWLSSTAAKVGGVEVMATRKLAPIVFKADPAAMACADTAFKAWVWSKGAEDLLPIDTKSSPVGQRLTGEGLEAVGAFPADKVFAVVRTTKDRCYLAVPESPAATYSVRGEDGSRLLPDGASASGWCSYNEPKPMSLWRTPQSSGAVLVFSAPADKLGGLAGVRDTCARAGFGQVQLTYSDPDLNPDAMATIRASGNAEGDISLPDQVGLPGKPDHLLTVFSLGKNANFFVDLARPVPMGCVPDPIPTTPPLLYTCVQARPQVYRSDKEAKPHGGIEGKLPFYMALFAGLSDKEGLKAAASLVAFSRRMNLLGYDATTTDGVVDQPDGAVVSGREGKPRTVAVGLMRKAPFVVPLSASGKWTLDSVPTEVSIEPGKSMRLRSAVPLTGDAKSRRVVVWRRP